MMLLAMNLHEVVVISMYHRSLIDKSKEDLRRRSFAVPPPLKLQFGQILPSIAHVPPVVELSEK